MPSVLCTASTFSHIVNFHLPYLRRFRELGWQVSVACGGDDWNRNQPGSNWNRCFGDAAYGVADR